jgi:predicted glutamine amidotransferase
MCGIYGFRVRKGESLSSFEATVLCTVMAREMEWRGKDSWGGVVFPKEGETVANIFKGTGKVTENASEFLRAASTAQTVLAHTRAATVGKVSKENSHPFLIGNVLGVHNGSIYNYKEMNTLYGRNFEVDSEHIFAHINDGLDLEELEGQGTFFYSRSDEDWKTIYLARTNNGSLFLSRFYRDNKHEHPFATVWASEKGAVNKAADLIGAYTTEVKIAPENLYCIAEDGEIYDKKQPFKLKAGTVMAVSVPYNYWEEHTAEPFGANISVVVSDREGIKRCSDCKCALVGHSSGMCDHNNLTSCRGRLRQKCLTNGLKICRSCHCYLVEGIHELVNEKVVCSECKKECHPLKSDTPKTQKSMGSDETVSENILKFFGKKARKKMSKKAKKVASRAWEKCTVEPLAKNIRPLNSTSRAYTQTGSYPICKECSCNLSDHLWGWCTNSGSSHCKASTKIDSPICHTDVLLCRDCGCHMVEGVHEETAWHSKVINCLKCNAYCSSDFNAAGPDEVDEVDEVTEQDSVESTDKDEVSCII